MAILSLPSKLRQMIFFTIYEAKSLSSLHSIGCGRFSPDWATLLLPIYLIDVAHQRRPELARLLIFDSVKAIKYAPFKTLLFMWAPIRSVKSGNDPHQRYRANGISIVMRSRRACDSNHYWWFDFFGRDRLQQLIWRRSEQKANENLTGSS